MGNNIILYIFSLKILNYPIKYKLCSDRRGVGGTLVPPYWFPPLKVELLLYLNLLLLYIFLFYLRVLLIIF